MIPKDKKFRHIRVICLRNEYIYRIYLDKINWAIKHPTCGEVSLESASTCLFKSGLPVKG